MNIFFWQRLRSRIKFLKYLAMLLMALWFSIAVPGCSLFQTNVPTVSSPEPTQTVSQTTASLQRLDGITINAISRDAPVHTGLRRHAAKFEALTGAKVNLTARPQEKLYSTLQKDWSSATSQYDLAVILPGWLIDFTRAGYLEDLTTRTQADSALQWEDVAPIFRVSATYQGRTYSVPLDGDFHMVYYRTDLLKQAELSPPATWEDYLSIAQQFHGKDLNGDGEPDYGSCIQKRPRGGGAAMLLSIATPFLQSQGTAQGAFFDMDTMKPAVNNPGFARALKIYKQTMDYGIPQDENLGEQESRSLFLAGRCALTLDWGDIGTLAIDPATSKVIDKVGAVVTPGTTQVLDRKTGQLVACDKFTCPYAIGGVNHAPYVSNIGWTGVIHAGSSPRVKDAAYRLLSFLSQPTQANVDVTIGATGFNPYRISQFENIAPWIKAGMSPDAANNYLGAIGVSLSSPNMVLDLRIPQGQRYQLQALDTVLADFLRNKITTEEAIQQIEQKWQQITNEVGSESQKAAYRSSLGLDA